MSPRSRLRRVLIGKPREILHPKTWHTISLIAVLAWVGLGADGLSSSAYGPDEAFRALGAHTYLAVALALATSVTVGVIAIAYSQIIKHFPFGGGGYIVATRLLGPNLGVISGAALLVDYVLTISVSIASGGDQIFSFLPAEAAPFKLIVEAAVISLMVTLNLRGVRESVTFLAPVFGLFVLTHAVLVFGGIGTHLDDMPRVTREVRDGFQSGLGTLGLFGLLAVFARAFTMGAGTYTGIEAVSNGIQIMREPKVETARRTMTYMAISLAVTASGILLCYLLFRVRPEPGRTMNAVLLDRFAGAWSVGGLPIGPGFVVVALVAEAALLFVAAQAGFIDGPRVMSNMAKDDWIPHRFNHLSERLTIQDGVLLMGGAALVTLLYTRGNITALVTMYAINVFVTFSLSQLGMLRFWLGRPNESGRGRGLAIHGLAFVLCLGILIATVYQKAAHGGWVTLLATGVVIAVCFWVRGHYRVARSSLRELEGVLPYLPDHASHEPPAINRKLPTAVLFVDGYSGLGIHSLLTTVRLFPRHFHNIVFASIGVIDAAITQGIEEVERLRVQTRESLERYVKEAHLLGLAADYRMRIGTEPVEEGEHLAAQIITEFPHAIFFMSNLVFQRERWFHRILHNQTAYRLQRRLQFAGLNTMVLPARVLEIGSSRS